MSTYTLDDLLNDKIEEDLTWDTFSPLVKGMPRKHKSALWAAYKESNDSLASVYKTIQEGTFGVEAAVESEEETKEETKEVAEEEVDYLAEYTRISNKLLRFGPSMSEDLVKDAMAMMKDLASKTIHPKYEVSDTDAWELWMSPTAKCLLVNATRQFSFSCTRAWWSSHYLNAMYVSRQLVNTEQQFDRLVAEKIASRRFIDRHPLPGIEIKLPTSAREFHLRDR